MNRSEPARRSERPPGLILLMVALLMLAGCVRFSSAEDGADQGALERAVTTITSRANGAMAEAAKLMAEGKPFPAMGVLGDEMTWFLSNPPERCYAEGWGRFLMAMQTASIAADFSRRAGLAGDRAALGLTGLFTASLDEQAVGVQALTTDCSAGPSRPYGSVDAAQSIDAILGRGRDTLALTAERVRQHDQEAAMGALSQEIDVLLANPPERCFAELWGRTLLAFQAGLLGADVSRQASAAGFELTGDLAAAFASPIDEHSAAIASVATPC